MAVKVQASDAPPSVQPRRHQPRGFTLLIAVFQSDHKPLRAFAIPALSAVLSVVRNAAFCSIVAWFANLCYAQGNVFSMTPVREQSYFAFIAAQVVMFHIFSSTTVLVMVAHVLQAQYRRSTDALNSSRPVPPIWVCFAKLVKHTLVLFTALLVLILLTTYALSLAPASIRQLKLEFYTSCILNHALISQADLVARTTIREEVAVRRPTIEVSAAELQQYQALVSSAPAVLAAAIDSLSATWWSSRAQ